MFTHADDIRVGVPLITEPYPDGEPGIQKSLKTICQKVREGAPTAVMKSFAGNILREAGFPRSARERGTALFEYVRKHVGYMPDALNTEQIQTAAVTLCVDGAPICIPIADCDDMTTATATLCAAAGIEVEIVRQFFGSEHQQHVMLEIKLEDGRWFPLDPSSKAMSAGQKAPASSETRASPWDSSVTGISDQLQFVGIGGDIDGHAMTVLVMTQTGQWQKAHPSLQLGGKNNGPEWWYETSAGVEVSIKPARIQGFGAVDSIYSPKPAGLLADMSDVFLSNTPLPKLSAGATVGAAGAIILGSLAIAAWIRRKR